MATTEEVYNELFQEICRVDSTWLMYRALFSEEAVQVLNSTAYCQEVFRRVQDSLGDSVFLVLCAFRDSDDDSLTFRKLFNKLAVPPGPTRTKIEDLLDSYDRLTVGVQKHRHKRIAHTDIKVATGSDSLPEIPVDDITKALQTIQELMREMQPLVPGNQQTVITLRDQSYSIGEHAREVISVLKDRKS